MSSRRSIHLDIASIYLYIGKRTSVKVRDAEPLGLLDSSFTTFVLDAETSRRL